MLKYLLRSSGTEEYRSAMIPIAAAVQKHERTLVRGKPQLNDCDQAAQVRCLLSELGGIAHTQKWYSVIVYSCSICLMCIV